MNHIRALQILAMHAVVKGDEDYSLRAIFRWYSKMFHTPLHVVETLPVDDILQHYYEVDYEDLEEPERKSEVERLLVSPEKLQRLRRQEDADDADAVEFGKEAEGDTTPVRPSTDPVTADPILERLERVRAATAKAKAAMSDLKEASLPPPPVMEEGVHMKFENLDEDLDDAPGFGPPKKP